MRINDKYAGIIVESLNQSIYHIRDAHQTKYRDTGYNYEKLSIAPISEALNAVRDAIEKSKH